MSGMELALVAISTGVQVAGAIQQGRQQDAMYKHQAALDEQNREYENQNRIRNIETARIAAEDKRRENTRRLASIRAAYGNTGIEMAGTPLDILSDAAGEMELDARRIEQEGQTSNRDSAIRMAGLSASAQMNRTAGKNAKSSGYMKAGGSLLGGASKFYSVGQESGYWGGDE